MTDPREITWRDSIDCCALCIALVLIFHFGFEALGL